MIVMGRGGIYRGIVEDSTLLINRVGADLCSPSEIHGESTRTTAVKARRRDFSGYDADDGNPEFGPA